MIYRAASQPKTSSAWPRVRNIKGGPAQDAEVRTVRIVCIPTRNGAGEPDPMAPTFCVNGQRVEVGEIVEVDELTAADMIALKKAERI